MHGKGGHVLQREACVVKGSMRGEGAMCGEGGGRVWQKTLPLQRTVRILLECILGDNLYTTRLNYELKNRFFYGNDRNTHSLDRMLSTVL